MRYFLIYMLILLSACSNSNNNLNVTQRDFIKKLFKGDVDDAPFQMRYTFRTVLFSNELISLFGETNLYNHLPHGSGNYEGKTYYKIDNNFREISLNDLFTTRKQKEFLRQYCELSLKAQSHNYFTGDKPIRKSLDIKDINTFVVDDRFLIIIFQPYTVGNYVDGPFFVKIPYIDLKEQWNTENPIASLLPLTYYVSSWENENISYRLQED